MMKSKLGSGGLTLIALCASAFAQQVPPPGQPLSAAQRTEALQTFQSVTLAESAANTFNPAYIPGTPGQDPVSQEFVQMTTLLRGSIQSGACVPKSQQTGDPDGNGTTFSFALSGTACQVSYDSEYHNTNTGSGNTSVTYQVNDPAYAALTDVDSFSFNTGATLTQTSGDQYQVTIQGKGSFHSQQLGELPFTMSGGGTFDYQGNGNLQETIQARFPGFAASFLTSSQSQGGMATQTYSLNDSPLTSDEVTTYINMPFVPRPRGSARSLF